MILLSIMEDPSTGLVSQRVVIPREDMGMKVTIRTPYLVAKGQTLDIGVMAQVMSPTTPRALLMAKGTVRVEGEWWRNPHCIVPSNRPLWEVLLDAVQHGQDNPSHGANCACMDSIVWELKRHVDRALPEVERRMENAGTPDETIRYNADQWEDNMKARQRLHVILGALARDL